MSFTVADLEDLARAARIVESVANRHHTDDLRAISALTSTLADIRQASRLGSELRKADFARVNGL